MQNISLMSVTELVEKNNIIFGPINSRRFGVSLGIDLSPGFKQCNFDCLYCELAPSATVAQQLQSISVTQIIEALQQHLDDKIDVITLTANGEPTLYPYLNELIEALNTIKGNTQILILSNSATLHDDKVYQALLKLDQVKLSLDAVSADIFKKIDRPHSSVKIDTIITKLQQFSKDFQGKLFIEILFVKGLNDTKEEIAKLNEVLCSIDATRIDLGTIDRPPAYPVEAISYEELHQLAQLFESTLPVHIASRKGTLPTPQSYTDEEILNTLDKRPLTLEDIELLFDKKSQQRVQEMFNKGIITRKQMGSVDFFIPTNNLNRKRLKPTF